MSPFVNRRLGVLLVAVSAATTLSSAAFVAFGFWLDALLIYVAALLALGVLLARLRDDVPARKAIRRWHPVAPPGRTLYARFSAMFRFYIT